MQAYFHESDLDHLEKAYPAVLNGISAMVYSASGFKLSIATTVLDHVKVRDNLSLAAGMLHLV